MAVELLIGRAGSGKTHAVYNGIASAREQGKRCFLIVADQATFEVESTLSKRLGDGLFDCEVLSWESLAAKVLADVGERRSFLSAQGRIMLTRRAVDAVQKDLTIFAPSAHRDGFAGECDSMIMRFKRCGIAPEDLAAAAKRLPDTAEWLRAKLHDFSLIYADVMRRMQSRYIDSGDMLNVLAERIDGSRLVGASVFVDCGNSLNEQSYRIIEKLLHVCSDVTLTVTVDPSPHCRDFAVFARNQRALARISDMVQASDMEVKLTALSPIEGVRAPACAILERELFAHPSAVCDTTPDGIAMFIAADRRTEVIELAERIRRAVSRGLRYRDISVAVSDLDAYAPMIARIFRGYGIPYYTDAKRPVAAHPLAGLILSALTAVEHGFDAESVIAVLKTGYADIPQDAAERFENHILAWGVRYDEFTRPFERGEPSPDVEEARRVLMEPLMRLRTAVRDADAAERAAAVFNYISDMGVYEKQRELCAALHAEGEFLLEEENAQMYGAVIELLDQVNVILGDERVGLHRFIAVLREGLAAAEVGTIPATVDSVLIGDVGRIRTHACRELFVLGMNDGLFPVRHEDDSVIDDRDLAELRSLGMTVWDTSAMQAESDLLDIYSAFAMPAERITLSYPVSVDSATAVPCVLWERVLRLFPNITVCDRVTEHPVSGDPDIALGELAADLRHMVDTDSPADNDASLYSWFNADAAYRDELALLSAALFESNSPAPLGRALARKLYGNSSSGSVSRLETFNACPFRHYVQYGLAAQQRREYREQATDLGTFYHAALDAYIRYVADNGFDWAKLSDERVLDILRTIVPPIMAEHNRGVMLSTARLRAAAAGMLDTVRATAVAITHQIACGSFRPFGSEVRFGFNDAVLPPLRLELPDGTAYHVRGVIDRIDVAASPEPVCRIVDYKTGDKRFNYTELAAGLQMQLPLYAAALAAVDAVGASTVVGMYYMHIHDPERDSEPDPAEYITPELMREFRLRGLTLANESLVAAADAFERDSLVLHVRRTADGTLSGSGLVSDSELERVIEHARSTAADTLAAIYDGHAEIRPYRISKDLHGCRYCDFADVCRFDPNAGSAYRNVPAVSRDGFLGRK